MEFCYDGIHPRVMRGTMEDSREKMAHLNLALRAIRNVNRLLVKQLPPAQLLAAVCETLVENRGYDKVWIIMFDEMGRIAQHAQAGFGSAFPAVLKDGRIQPAVACAAAAMSRPDAVLIKQPTGTCGPCPLTAQHAGWGVLTVRLAYRNETYGLLCVSIPRELVSDDVERALVEEIAEDIAYGLYRMRREEIHRRADAALKKRVKELNGLYAFTRLVERPHVTLPDILQGGVDLLPDAMLYPEISCARVRLDDQVYQSAGFRETPWRLEQDLLVDGRVCGALEVCLLEQRPPRDVGPFLKEEADLLLSLARRMGRTVERKRGRKALEESEKRFRDVVENSLTCISIIQDQQIVYKNPEYERLFGLSRSSFLLPDYENIHPDDIAAVDAAVQRFLNGGSRGVNMEFRFLPPRKTEAAPDVKWFHCRVSTIEHNGREAILLNLMDISRAKELEQLLRIQDKMTSLGRVAAGIAHEIRNPLSGINIYLKALEKINRQTENSPKVDAILSQLRSASNKIESVIRRVMDFSRPSEPAFVLTDLNQPVREAVNLSAVTLRKSGVQLKTDLKADLPACRADPHMIEQVILNLIANASEAMQTMEADKKIAVVTRLKPPYVCISVADSGPGVPDNISENIFDPFYTTKNNSSGIGLSICQRIVADHGGSLEVTTAVIGGACFVIKIPAAVPAPAAGLSSDIRNFSKST